MPDSKVTIHDKKERKFMPFRASDNSNKIVDKF